MTARLKSKGDFDRVFSRGRATTAGRLSLRSYFRGDDDPTRFGWVVGRGTGGAVDRNRLRRQLRGVISTLDIRPGFDCVVVARGPTDRNVQLALTELLEESGLTGDKVS
jgi:ribonuclease P protein component